MTRWPYAAPKIALALALCMSAGSATAESELDRTGPYLSTNFFLAFDKFKLPVEFNSAPGADVRLGYRLHRWFAAEAQFQWARYEDSEIGTDVSFDTYAFSVNGKIPLLSGPIQPYAYGGLGVLRASVPAPISVRETVFAPRFGGGIDLFLNDNIALTSEVGYVLPLGALKQFEHFTWTIGIQIRP